MNKTYMLLLCSLASVLCLNSQASNSISTTLQPSVIVDTSKEPVAEGKFQPTWKSLSQYQCPDWFRDAKFGIWAHWGPQCEPEDGDWYARFMYDAGSKQNKDHVAKYGDPAKFGFKDIIHIWKAEKWDPSTLVALYKRVGAQYFFAMANHHDNFDLWDSKYQPWNSVAIGPKKDIIAGWAKAAREQGLPFGVSVHAAFAPLFYQPSQAYDGLLTKADGKGLWWDGLDPQLLYAQSQKVEKPGPPSKQWGFATVPVPTSEAFCQQFYNRVADLIKKYQPDLIYFDNKALPLWPRSDAGLKIAADFYNTNLKKTGGKSDGVLFGKNLNDFQRKCLVWDIERGVPSKCLSYSWQTDTCIGHWHYDRALYDRNGYKSAATIIHMLCDIVSKNGNLLLNVPVRGDGSIDEKEEKILEDIAAWMDVNKESIFGTRPWKVFGEGPASAGAQLSAPSFNEGHEKAFTAEDVRFTLGKDGSLYAIALGRPQKKLSITSLGVKTSGLHLTEVTMLGSAEKVVWKQSDDDLVIQPPNAGPISDIAVVYKIVNSLKLKVLQK